MYFRKIALASVLAGGFVLPVLAQTPAPDATPAPQADSSSAVPDTGVKKAPAATVKHKRHTHVAKKAKADAASPAN